MSVHGVSSRPLSTRSSSGDIYEYYKGKKFPEKQFFRPTRY